MDNSTQADAEAKRRRPVAGLPGQGPPGDPETAVLLNPTLLVKCWPTGGKELKMAQAGSSIYPDLRNRLGTFRLVSKDARLAFDSACEAPLMFAPQRQREKYMKEGREPAGPRPSQALDWALGMLQRGRRPREVRFGVNERIRPEEWRQGALDLLQAFPQLSGRPGQGVVSLLLPPELLSPSTALLIAGAFPNLARLELSMTAAPRRPWEVRPVTSPEALAEAARGLALLLGVRSGPEGGDAPAAAREGTPPAEACEGAGIGPEQCRPPLLPCLTALGLSGPVRLPPGYAPLLRQATQLRTLELSKGDFADLTEFGGAPADDEGEPEWGGRGALEELTSLTQLTALSLRACSLNLLPVLTGALTSLTSLELTGQNSNSPLYLPLSPSVFAPLKSLQRLEVPRANLEAAGLAQALSSLTCLSVGGFTLPAQELSQPLTSIPRWPLPAGLRELGLYADEHSAGAPPEALAGLELHDGLRLDQASSQTSFLLNPRHHTAPAVEEGGLAGTELLPAAEEALCGALSFVRQHGLLKSGRLSVIFNTDAPDRLLQPFGGAAGTGPGRPSHGRWLREVGALGPKRLTLEGFELSYEDVETMRDGLEEVESLWLGPPSQFPLPALPLLAGPPRLRSISLDGTPWAGDDPASTELRDQALASLVALARARPEGRRLALEVLFASEVNQEGQERVQALATRAREEMVAGGVRPIRMMVRCLYLPSDLDADEDVDVGPEVDSGADEDTESEADEDLDVDSGADEDGDGDGDED
ncbi:hypothetical protein HYH03_001162 [Edaphochlamys debaryana]|uniref:Uncharacterized protein n=1 Tax=Edaphochlamys debaryana TaxID=47281 RepID=A0A836C743_9CHLO|nr:hypothetical protein HYH03_001162 [Edaphochlamys debaryana]|eukprot:KAG2501372.1 hypothetical protein HYH03_001162 [Edaphochlamys debaryana]